MTEGFITNLAKEVSLAATVPTIWLCVVVLRLWGLEALKEAFNKYRAPATWMLMGVALSFLGKLGDNSWWGIAWLHSYFAHPGQTWWFENGVFSNVIFRQALGVAAGYCHVRSGISAMEARGFKLKISANQHLVYSSIVGVVLWVFLHWYKSTL